jgi:WD40 repeat protein
VLKLWEVSTGDCLRRIGDHRPGVSSVTLSEDGRLAISGGWDGRALKLWHIETSRCLRTIYRDSRSEGPVRSVVLSADGQLALSVTGQALELWDITSGRCLRSLQGHTDQVLSADLMSDGQFALSGSLDRTLKLWDVGTGKCLRTFDGHTQGVRSVVLSRDGQLALSGSSDGSMRLWDVESGRCLRTLEGPEGNIESVALSLDCVYALSAGSRGLRIWYLDWELEDKSDEDWDARAVPILKAFLSQQIPYAGSVPKDRPPTEEEIWLALTRVGSPSWSAEDFRHLLTTLTHCGFGRLRPNTVQVKLEAIATEQKRELGVFPRDGVLTRIVKRFVDWLVPISDPP